MDLSRKKVLQAAAVFSIVSGLVLLVVAFFRFPKVSVSQHECVVDYKNLW